MVETNDSILSVHSGEKRKVAELRRDGTNELIQGQVSGSKSDNERQKHRIIESEIK